MILYGCSILLDNKVTIYFLNNAFIRSFNITITVIAKIIINAFVTIKRIYYLWLVPYCMRLKQQLRHFEIAA